MEQLRARIIYVIGGPGGGKGTQCANLIEAYGFQHISIGDLMRAEIKAGSEEGKTVEAIVKSGNLVPKELTVALLLRHLSQLEAHTVLIDGFPRSLDQAVYLEQITRPFDFILYFETDREDILVNRLIERGKTSGRADDQAETIVHRFQVYKSESMPVIKLYDPFNVIRRVDCLGSIKEVYQRTVRAMRPEVYFILGCTLAGKSSVSQFLATRYNATVLDIEQIAKKRVHNRWVPIEDDIELVDAVIQALEALQHDYRAVVEGFPRNAQQARRFSYLSGKPDKVIYLRCSKDMAQTRFIEQKSPESLQVFNTAYEKFSQEIYGISQYFREHCENYSEVSTDDKSFEATCQEVGCAFQPEVVLARGNVTTDILNYFESCGYKLLNAANLLALWRQGRGLSESGTLANLTEDPELLDILKRALFSGVGRHKFLVYNFLLEDSHLLAAFEENVCRVTQAYYFSASPPAMCDSVTLQLFREGRLSCITDCTQLQLEFKELFGKADMWAISLLGAGLTGKSDVAKKLSDQLGFPIVDFNQIIEDTKTFLSTEDEPKESLTYTEFLEGVQRYCQAHAGKTVIVDGYPNAEMLTAPGDSDFPDVPNFVPDEDEENRIPVEENLSVGLRAQAVTERLRALYQKLNVLMAVELEAPLEELYTRARTKNELGEEDAMPAELQAEVLEGWMVYEELSEGTQLVPGKIARRLQFDVSAQSITEVSKKIVQELSLRVILIKNDTEVIRPISSFLWKHNLFAIDLAQRGSLQKVQFLKSELTKKPLRNNVVVITNYSCEGSPSVFTDLELIEENVGKIQALVGFSEGKEEVLLEAMPVRKRIVKQDESKKDDDDDDEPPAVPVKSAPAAEEEEVEVKWNDNQPSTLFKVFYNFRGQKGEHRVVSVEETSPDAASLLAVLDEVGSSCSRFTVQVQLTFNAAKALDVEIAGWTCTPSAYYEESLPVDVNSLFNLKLLTQSILDNEQAADFHRQFLSGLTCPFTVFWKHFAEQLTEQEIEPTMGLKRAIKKSIDRNGNGFIDLYELNRFFSDWQDENVQPNIIKLGKDLERKQDRISALGLFMLVENSSKDPDTGALTFARGSCLELEGSGLPSSSRYCKDKIVYFGRQTKLVENDVEFSSADTRVAFSHFSIVCKMDGFYLVDNAGVWVRAKDFPFTLFTDAVVHLANTSFRVKELRQPAARKDDYTVFFEYKNAPPAEEGEPLLVLEGLTGDLKGRTFTFGADQKKVSIGSAESSEICVPSAEYYHATIELKASGWCILDLYSCEGVWLQVKTYERAQTHKPSLPLKIYNNCVIAVPGTQFRCVYKDEDKPAPQLDDSCYRCDSFRRLYRMSRITEIGSLFKVYECFNKATKTKCAAIVIKLEHVTPELNAFFNKVARLRHPSLQKVLEIIKDGDSLHIIAEHYSQDLFGNIEAVVSEKTAAAYMKQILAGLNVLHSEELLHGSLTPGTLYLTSDRKDHLMVKLTGFIQSKIEAQHNALNTLFCAPEALRGKPTPQSDIWSCGVLLYALLAGLPAFDGPLEELRSKIDKAVLAFPEEAWAGVSSAAKLLVRKMLGKRPSDRPTSAALLKTPWVNGQVKFLDMEAAGASSSLPSLKQFTARTKTSHALQQFIRKFEACKAEQEQVMQLFQQIDVNKEGKLSRSEIMQAFQSVFVELSEGELENIIRTLDADMSGFVTYSEFSAALTTKRLNFNQERLEDVFKALDTDGSGALTSAELKVLLGGAEEQWQELISKVDSNEDGKIGMNEFKDLLLSQLQPQ